MTWKCCVWSCRSSLSTRGMRFFRFPIPGGSLSRLKTKRFEAWRRALGYSDGFVPFNKRVCSLHFVTGNPARLTDVDNRDWVPSLNLRKKSLGDEDSKVFHRHPRNKRRKTSSESSSSNRSSGRGRQHRKISRPSSHGSQTSLSSKSDSQSDARSVDSLKAQSLSGTSMCSSKSSVSRKKSLDDEDSKVFHRHPRNKRRKTSSESSSSNRSSGGDKQHRKKLRPSSHGSQTSLSSKSDARSDDSLKAQSLSGTSMRSSKSSVSRDLLSLRGSECQRDSGSGSSSSSAAKIPSPFSSTSSRKSRRISSSYSSFQSDNSRKSQLSQRTLTSSSECSGGPRESTRDSCSQSSSSDTTSDKEDGTGKKDDVSFTDKNFNSGTDCEVAQKYKRELEVLQKKIVILSEKANMNERGFYFISVTNAKCLYYTGITNFQTVRRIFEYLEGNLSKPYCNFTKEQVFVMTLTKLRLNPQFQTLAYEYNVSLNTISKYFHRTLDIIDRCLSYALEAPTKDVLLKHTPRNFKDQFGDVRVFIVDCFEVRSETPEKAKAAVTHFSNYKKSETTKFLIAICPDGNISFISPSYGGRCSDKKIFKESGFIDILQPGDVVLADKGFDVDDLVRSRGAKLNIPTFLKQKQQFKPAEIEKNKQITRLRIHVERCIGVLKMKFLVMTQIITVDSLVRFENNKNIVDLTARVCCILYNFNPSIIPE